MANFLGPRVQLELFHEGRDVPAVIGTDGIVFVDGRWSRARAVAAIEAAAVEVCRRKGMEWRRSVYLMGGRYYSVKV